MSSTPAAAIPKSISQTVLPPATAPGTMVSRSTSTSAAPKPPVPQRGYGLPCAKCRTYYPSDLASCPVCKHGERVSPVATPASSAAVQNDASKSIEQEREKFLREFKSQVYASHMQINASESFRCKREEHHPSGFEPATVCQSCYDHLEERTDRMEAALHMELADAAQIVYDAVWADPSDPSKTYEHAAAALLNELRKRAGISRVSAQLQPKAH